MYDSYDKVCSLCEKEFRADKYEERFCWECHDKNEITMELVAQYLKDNLSIEVDKDYDSYTTYIKICLKDKEICSTSFSTRTEN